MIKKNQVTISDVAKKTGVSPSTVSRVISNSPRISDRTKEKVLKCMDELGYYPNAIARSLVNSKTGNIGVIMPTRSEDVLLNPFFSEALRGIVKNATNSGYDVLLSTNSESKDELSIIKDLIRGSKVDGMILMSSKINDENIDYLTSIGFPFSLIGTPYGVDDGINHVDNDNFMAAYELTMYLTSMGKKSIAMIAGDSSLMVTKKRIEGYKKAIEISNLDFNENQLFIGNFDEETGYRYGREILELDPRPDAVIVTDDLVAFAAIQVLENSNVRIPQDIAVASFNNSVLSRYSQNPFTSVDVNAYDLGYQAISLLVQVIKGEIKNRRIIIPYTIHKRKSTEAV